MRSSRTSVIYALALLPFAFAQSPPDAHAGVRICGDRAKLVAMLEKKYKEVPAAIGVSQASTEAFEIFTSDTGTWTVVMTRPNGKACIMAAGHSWSEFPRKSLDPQT